MGLFDKMFNSEKKEKSEKKNSTPWIDLNSMEQLDEMENISEEKMVAVLKHSTTCGISRMVLKMFESDYDLEGIPLTDDIFLQDTLNDFISDGKKTWRLVRNRIADIFDAEN